jgi:hypothetical protein
MFSNKKITPYIFVFLAFSVISSKHIIIYNEEILVSLSFLYFVIFVSFYFGDTIKESLDERKKLIESELQNFLNLKKESYKTLFKIHEKAFLSYNIITNLIDFTTLKVKTKKAGSLTALRNLSYSNFNLKSKLMKFFSDILLTAVLMKNQNSVSRQIKKTRAFTLISKTVK